MSQRGLGPAVTPSPVASPGITPQEDEMQTAYATRSGNIYDITYSDGPEADRVMGRHYLDTLEQDGYRVVIADADDQRAANPAPQSTSAGRGALPTRTPARTVDPDWWR